MTIGLIISHARHMLRRANPDYDELLEELESAQKSGASVLVTETRDEHEIIDVRKVAEGEGGAAAKTSKRPRAVR
jgi:hypothetical protein